MASNNHKCDSALGQKIQKYLIENNTETPIADFNLLSTTDDERLRVIESNIANVLMTLGLDLTNDSLQDTPKRVAKMYLWEIFHGLDYKNFPKITTVQNTFGVDEMVLEKNINVMSTCEHHMLPIHGMATVAYIPQNKVVGLSKMNRIVEFFSKRPQVQERLTNQIFYTMKYLMETEDIGITIDAKHYCVICRGIEDVNSSTITSKLGGCFKSDPACRSEFMSLAGRS